MVAAIAAAGGQAVTIPGISSAQIAAAQLGRLTAFAKSYQYLFISVIPWSVLGALGECSMIYSRECTIPDNQPFVNIAMLFLRPVHDQMTWVIDKPVETKEALGLRVATGDEAGAAAEVAR